MNEDDARKYENGVADVLTEIPQGIDVGERRFYLYPVSLGKSYLLARLTADLNIDAKLLRSNPFAEALRLTIANTDKICQIIALHTARTQRECSDTKRLAKVAKYFSNNLKLEELAQLFLSTLSDDKLSGLMKYLGIDADNRRRGRVQTVKSNDRNTYTFGGNSIFGAMIVPACEKLNMTPRQIVWDISLNFLRLLMADSISQIYLTDEERKRCRVSNDNDRINGDDPASQERIRQMKWS